MSAQLIENAGAYDPWAGPVEELDPAQPALFEADAHWGLFERLRAESPVHYTPDGPHGAYWSVTRYQDIFTVDTNHETFSSARGIALGRKSDESRVPEEQLTEEQRRWRDQMGGFSMFIAMDPPRHDLQRATVAPVVAPPNLALLEDTIRERAGRILDELPRGETFNWVDKVSVELTTQMLATIFDFPFDDRYKLTQWSDIVTGADSVAHMTGEERRAALMDCLGQFTMLWNAKVDKPATPDLVSMLANGAETREMKPFEFLGNLILLIVGGNDTTRNSISGGVLALNQNPAQYDKLRSNPDLIGNMVSEIIRWQTPLAHMRRTVTRDTEVAGKKMREGDKVVMWYVSGNRDDAQHENPNDFIIDRVRAREHLSFGFGIHRCMGNRLAEMQLRVLWEEIQKRFEMVEVMDAPKRTRSIFIKGYSQLPVRVHDK